MPLTSPPAWSLLSRLVRWIGRVERHEAAVRAQTEVLEHTQQVTVEPGVHPKLVSLIERDGVEQNARQSTVQIEHMVGGVRALDTNNLPLIRIKTATGTQYYMRRLDYLSARSRGATDVSLCRWNGQPIDEGSSARARLRVSTVIKSELTPVDFHPVEKMLYSEQSAEGMGQERNLNV